MAGQKLTLEQRVSRLPNAPAGLYTDVMRVASDLRMANRTHPYNRRDERRLAMRNAALAINSLRRFERAALRAEG